MTIASQKLFTNCRIGPRVSDVTTVPACIAPGLPRGNPPVSKTSSTAPPRGAARAAGPPRPLPLPLRRALLPRCRAPRRPSRPATSPASPCAPYQLGQGISELCTLKAAQTPNVDLLKPTIDWDAPQDFGGLSENFVVEALANLDIPTAGSYTFRLLSDDGSRAVHRRHQESSTTTASTATRRRTARRSCRRASRSCGSTSSRPVAASSSRCSGRSPVTPRSPSCRPPSSAPRPASRASRLPGSSTARARTTRPATASSSTG